MLSKEPCLLPVQPPCSRQVSSGMSTSRNGAAKGTGEMRGLWGTEFKPPRARDSSTAIEASSHSLHRYTSSATLCSTSFPGSMLLDSCSPEETHALLLASKSQRPPGPPCTTGCCCSGQERGRSFLSVNILVSLLGK